MSDALRQRRQRVVIAAEGPQCPMCAHTHIDAHIYPHVCVSSNGQTDRGVAAAEDLLLPLCM